MVPAAGAQAGPRARRRCGFAALDRRAAHPLPARRVTELQDPGAASSGRQAHGAGAR